MSIITTPILDSCPRGGFFDGNDDFGGMPFRFLMALLVASPLVYVAGSASVWAFSAIRRCRRSSSNADPSAYRSMDNSNSPRPIEPPNTSSSDDVISISTQDEEPSSPTTSSAIQPASCSPSASKPSQVVNPFLRARAAHSAYLENLRAMLSSMSPKYRILMFCRVASRPINLYKFCVVMASIHLVLNIIGLVYGFAQNERCCAGGTGALYAILALRICMSYLSMRVVKWQTNSDTYVIPLSDKACNVGFLVHEIWLAIAFIFATPGDCATNAPVMYSIGMYNIICLIIQIAGLFVLSVIIKHTDGLPTVISRTLLKMSLSGWSYGGPLDLPDAATGVEIEIACLPCLPYGPNVHEMLAPLKEAAEMDGTIQLDTTKDKAAMSACPSTVLNVDALTPSEAANACASDRSKCEAGLSCAICLNGYELNEMIRPLPCGHHFHKNCTDTWLRVKSTCPLCVRSVLLL